MGIERKFVQDGLTKARINEYFTKQLERAGYGGMVINRTPMGTQITLFAEKPGMVIGKGGKTIHRLTNDMSYVYNVDNPQIDVQEIKVPELNAQMMANRLANALERGWYFRKAGYNMLRRIMDSGALGCEIVLSGKFTGPRSKVSKMVEGYIKHAGKPAEELVDTGFATAVKKLGTIGCRVRIVQPGTELPASGCCHSLLMSAHSSSPPLVRVSFLISSLSSSLVIITLDGCTGLGTSVPSALATLTPSTTMVPLFKSTSSTLPSVPVWSPRMTITVSFTFTGMLRLLYLALSS